MRLAPLLLCSVLLCAVAAHAQPRPPEVSARNFVALEFRSSNFLRPFSDSFVLRVRGRTLSRTPLFVRRGASGAKPVQQGLSPVESKELLAELRNANVPRIAGRYFDKSVLDAPSRSLSLTLFDASRRKRTYTVSSYGYKAPASFGRLAAFLRALGVRKFGVLRAPKAR